MPETELTLSYEVTERAAITRMSKYCGQALPVSATCFDGNRLYIRLSGSAAGVKAAKILLGGEILDNAEEFWQKIREQTHTFFDSQKPLWRLSLAPATPPIDIEGKQLIEWRGAQRWLLSDALASKIREKLQSVAGHATLFRRGNREEEIFQPLHGKLRELHMNIKLAMDPHCIFNIGKMYPDF
jgi:glycolate oxidase FAD binding subunit